MFNRKNNDPDFNVPINNLLPSLNDIDGADPEYAKIVEQMTALHQLKMQETASKRINLDTVLTVAGNLVGIAIIIGHERGHVITTKAFDRVKNLR